MKPWTILNSRYHFKRWWMNLREDHVLLPNGTEIPEFHVLEYPDWSCILCRTPEGQFVLVEQFRHGIRKSSLELPSGMIEPEETPLEAARRELREETGYEAERWRLVGRCAPEPSKHTNYAYIFFADGAVRTGDPALDESEDLAVRLVDASELVAAADEGRLDHGIHLLGVHWARSLGLLDGLE